MSRESNILPELLVTVSRADGPCHGNFLLLGNFSRTGKNTYSYCQTSNQSFTIIICFREGGSDLLSVLPNSFQNLIKVEDLLDSEKQIIHLL